MKLAVHLPVFGRFATVKKACDSLDRILEAFDAEGIPSDVYMIGHEPKMKRLANSRGYNFVYAENKPLGKKFNIGVQRMLEDTSWTHMMEFCSDNLLEESYPKLMIERMRNGEEFIGLLHFYIVHHRTKRALLFSRNAPTNVGRVTDRRILETMKRRTNYWFEPRKNAALDSCMAKRALMIGKAKPTYIETETPLIVDIKDAGSMHAWETFKRNPEKYPVVDLKGNFPELNLKLERDGST
jgi:hypothetical protein